MRQKDHFFSPPYFLCLVKSSVIRLTDVKKELTNDGVYFLTQDVIDSYQSCITRLDKYIYFIERDRNLIYFKIENQEQWSEDLGWVTL